MLPTTRVPLMFVMLFDYNLYQGPICTAQRRRTAMFWTLRVAGTAAIDLGRKTTDGNFHHLFHTKCEAKQ